MLIVKYNQPSVQRGPFPWKAAGGIGIFLAGIGLDIKYGLIDKHLHFRRMPHFDGRSAVIAAWIMIAIEAVFIGYNLYLIYRWYRYGEDTGD